ncbi:LPXTG cell wall anchor domain-containing protein [Limosilactobacillus sp. c9Ua_26_M]|uniref:LPXTG cell wall anchor domain-containing protein n=1 Tax=Limosilactobacillus urinaemulieris TaxID=2742600 RepID=A0ABR8ZJ20_9LACO|nr:LPXTG cell wall anchor domain-containing protein [Limosilactobacillus urinaemulieris]MBD8084731.1 LPXTG cell wall anchor domain-containing protein [Limosilactobacillus urinaemulieris]
MSNKKSIIKQCVGITSATVLMTMAVSVGTGHSATQKLDPTAINQQLDNRDEVRQITRTIKIDDPYKGMQTVKQTVTFKKIANSWQPQTPSIWSSFFIPNYDDFEPNVLQVRAQLVSANDSDQTISVTYHQYKIADRERLVEARPSFYCYDENLKFTGKALNSTTLNVGQWYDVPSAPKGFEYCCPESLPKRLKLYQSRQDPFIVLIRPLQKLNEHPAEEKAEQKSANNEQLINQPEEKELVATGSQTELVPSNDNETQTTEIQRQDQGQQTPPPSSKDEESQSKQLGKDAEIQTDNHETRTNDTQTEKTTVKQEESQTDESPKNDHDTQTDSLDEEQPSQNRIKEKTDPAPHDALTGSDQCPNHDNHESNEATKGTQTEIVLRPNSVSQKEQEAQTAEIETNNDNQQVVESRQNNSQAAQDQRSDNKETSIGNADVQKILDRDLASLKELSSNKNKDQRHRVKLPQTGNQTDNRTTFVGLVITGLVTIITMFFWKRRKKE